MISKYNQSEVAKVRVREMYAGDLPPSARVFEAMAGTGMMYARIWHRYKGLCVDVKRPLCELAVKDRPRWGVYMGKAEVCLATLATSVPFDVVDIDAFGGPWKYVQAWMTSPRVRAPLTRIFITDGYGRNVSVGAPSRALFPEFHAHECRKERAIPKAIRFEVLQRDGNRCQSCGRSPPDVVLHVDHIIPAYDGGREVSENLVTRCAECNQGRGFSGEHGRRRYPDRVRYTPEEYYDRIRAKMTEWSNGKAVMVESYQERNLYLHYVEERA